MLITRIVSGGQTGADRGGLDASIYLGLPHGGWCPKGRKAEDGAIPEEYRLREMPSADYLQRTEANVVDSDVTLIVAYGRPTEGSRRTVELARKHAKPYHCVDLSVTTHVRAVRDVVQWLAGDPALNEYEDYTAVPPANCVLNVAGSRESKSRGLQQATMRLVVDLLRQVNPECAGLYPVAGAPSQPN